MAQVYLLVTMRIIYHSKKKHQTSPVSIFFTTRCLSWSQFVGGMSAADSVTNEGCHISFFSHCSSKFQISLLLLFTMSETWVRQHGIGLGAPAMILSFVFCSSLALRASNFSTLGTLRGLPSGSDIGRGFPNGLLRLIFVRLYRTWPTPGTRHFRIDVNIDCFAMLQQVG